MGKTTYKKLYLRCTFTNEELSDIAATMADKTQELKRIDANAKAAAAQFKSDKESAQNEIDNAARKYRDGYEMRDVECEETVDFEEGVARYYRTDNGELAQVRKLTNEERQMRLDEIAGPDEQQALPAPADDDSGDPEHDAHVSGVVRFMSQERAVQM